MPQKDNILQELNELKSMLANTIPQNIYAVPAGYFDALASQVLSRIKAMEAANASVELEYLSPMLNSIDKKMPYAVPAGYFDGLAENAMQSVRESTDYQSAAEELEMLSPLLGGLKKQMPYSIPEGYFENLTQKIVSEENKPAKVVSITGRKWIRYAAAAVITGLIAMTAFFFNGEPGARPLAKFTRDVKKMDERQKEKLIDFIDAGMNGEETAQVNSDSKANEVKDLLKGISEEELKDFQEQTDDIQDILMTE